MPCRCDDYPETIQPQNNQAEKWLRKQADNATFAACEMRTVLRNNNLENKLSPRTLAWIKRHDEEDAKREREKRTEQSKADTKKSALNKLTKEEKIALGLDN